MKLKENVLGLALLTGILLVSCESKKTEQITGDLYFPWLKMANFYGLPDSVYQYYSDRKSALGIDSLKKEDPKGTEFIMMLEENGLLFTPYVYVQVEKDKQLLLFMDSATYQPFTRVDYQNLRNEKMKIRIRATAEKISPLAYIVNEIHRMDKVAGETLLVEKKFRIKNYQ